MELVKLEKIWKMRKEVSCLICTCLSMSYHVLLAFFIVLQEKDLKDGIMSFFPY